MTFKVLIVDDEPNVRLLLSRVMERLGCITQQSSNGVEAETLITEVKPDLVLLDIMMPMQDGYQTCRHIRRNGFTGPVIMVSAMSPQTARQIALDCGADDYLQKPVSRETFAALLATLTQQSVSTV